MKFSVGEIAILVGVIYHPKIEGEECEISGDLKIRYGQRSGPLMAYEIICGGTVYLAAPSQLRKKKPPLSTWEQVQADTQWNPNKVMEGESR